MGHAERRNLYRVLHVQPEAPQVVIKASYRALMSTLRSHPDLGGDHEHAAQLNAAYAVLGDPERRAAYDSSLRRAPRRAAAAAPPAGTPRPARDPSLWRDDRCCPMCGTAFGRLAPRAPRCSSCDGPLTPAPSAQLADGELLGRRRGERYARPQDAQLRLAPGGPPQGVRVKDLSLTGISLHCRTPLPQGTPFRVTAAGFDAVAVVVARRPQDGTHTVHARLLTLQVLRSPAGTFVSARA
jgi:curved DNA-binding protein CbpA